MDISQISNQTSFSQINSIENENRVEQSQKSVTQKINEDTKKIQEENETQKTQLERMQDEEQKSRLKNIVDELNKNLDPLNTSLKFGFHDDSKVYYVSVIDTHTNNIIRKFPSDEATKLSLKMKELVGMMFDQKG